MAIPPYLQDKHLTSKKRFSGKFLFNIIFILSLGLNVYLLNNPQNSGLNVVSENVKIEAENEEGADNKGAMKNANAVENAEAIESIETINLAQTPPQEVLARATPSPDTVASMEPVLSPEPVTGNVSSQPKFTPVSYVVPREEDNRAISTLHLKVRNSLTYSTCKAMTKEQGCQTMSAYMSRLLSWNFNVNKSMRNGDSIDVIYEKVPDKTRFRILKLMYDSQLFNKTYEANYFNGENDKWGSYFDADGQEIAQRVMDQFAPVKNYQEITSLPGDFRKGPVGHKGTDFKTNIGTPVYASFEAKVLRINWNVRVNGYCVELDHPREGVKTLYLHLSRVLVKPGQFVKQGDKIAETGNTGRTFAPHLHYEIKSRDKKKIVYTPFNFKHIKTYYKNIPLEERENFQKTVNLYDSILQKG